MLDYCYTAIFVIVTVLLYLKLFQYWMFIIVALLLGSIDGTYMVAFDSIFPLLTTTKTSRKAYSINSMLYPIASVITAPITLIGYEAIGAVNIFMFSSILFFITATIETQIIVREPHLVQFQPEKQAKLPPSPKELELAEQGIDITTTIEKKQRSSFIEDFKIGVKYIASEKGLMAITMYFFVISLCGAVQQTLMLPYFRSSSGWVLFDWQMEGMYAYIIVFGASTIGRLVGANILYKVKYPVEKKFNIALFVYITTNIITIIVFHLPLWLMMLCMFVEGTLSVTSYNIRIASTQHYVPDNKRGRFNGVFLFFNMLGSIGGQLIAGAIGDLGWSVPIIVSVTFAFNLAAIFFIIVPNAKNIKPIYNVDL